MISESWESSNCVAELSNFEEKVNESQLVWRATAASNFSIQPSAVGKKMLNYFAIRRQ